MELTALLSKKYETINGKESLLQGVTFLAQKDDVSHVFLCLCTEFIRIIVQSAESGGGIVFLHLRVHLFMKGIFVPYIQ